MTRIEQQDKEERVVNRLLHHLSKTGHEVDFEPEKIESPDFRIVLDGKRVGLELSRMTFVELEKFARGMEANEEKFHQKLLENRSDEWMEEVLERKTKKVNQYRNICDCEDLWLVVHFGAAPVIGHNKRDFERMQKAIRKRKHGFDQIWFVGDTTDIRRLYPEQD